MNCCGKFLIHIFSKFISSYLYKFKDDEYISTVTERTLNTFKGAKCKFENDSGSKDSSTWDLIRARSIALQR